MSSLRPVAGPVQDLVALLRAWQEATLEPEPLLVETSGSTGQPKRVVLSRAAMRASAAATHERLGGPGQWLLALPAEHVAGVQVLFRSLLAGAEPVVLAEQADLVAAVRAMTGPRRYLSLVPTQLARLLDEQATSVALHQLDAVLVGGGPFDPALRERAEQAGVRVVASYGMSETCGGCVYDGRPLDGVAVALAEDGRIRIAGPVLFDGYDEAPDLTAQVLADGWFLTSDLGRLDDDGRLVVLGRVDDVIVTGGVNVPAAAVAARLREHTGVVDAEVVGVRDADWGHRVVAVVVGDPGELADVRDFVAARHPRTWAPRQLLRVGELPRLATGKPDRVALVRLAEERA